MDLQPQASSTSGDRTRAPSYLGEGL